MLRRLLWPFVSQPLTEPVLSPHVDEQFFTRLIEKTENFGHLT